MSFFTPSKHWDNDGEVNPIRYNVEKWQNVLLKYCGVDTARFLKYGYFSTICMKGLTTFH